MLHFERLSMMVKCFYYRHTYWAIYKLLKINWTKVLGGNIEEVDSFPHIPLSFLSLINCNIVLLFDYWTPVAGACNSSWIFHLGPVIQEKIPHSVWVVLSIYLNNCCNHLYRIYDWHQLLKFKIISISHIGWKR